MLRIVAEYAETWNSFGSPAEMRERGQLLDEQCRAIDRDPASLRHSLYGWASVIGRDPWASVAAFEDMIGEYREAGVSDFVIDAPDASQFAIVERVATDLLPKLRAPMA